MVVGITRYAEISVMVVVYRRRHSARTLCCYCCECLIDHAMTNASAAHATEYVQYHLHRPTHYCHCDFIGEGRLSLSDSVVTRLTQSAVGLATIASI